jgi:hypothetical protein
LLAHFAAPWGTNLSTWALTVVPIGVPLNSTDRSPVDTGEVRFHVASVEAERTDTVPFTLAGSWASHLAFSVRRCEHPSVRQQWLQKLRPSPLWQTWTRGEFDWTSSHPSLLYPPERLLSGERCREIHLRIYSFNWSSGHCPGIRRTYLSVADLPEATRGIFFRGGRVQWDSASDISLQESYDSVCREVLYNTVEAQLVNGGWTHCRRPTACKRG